MTDLYRSFGLTFASDFPLEGFLPAASGMAPDIVIETGPAARGEANATGIEPRTVVPASGGILFHMPDIAAFWVRDGKRIDLSPAAGADPAHIRLYLIGSAMGLILHQRDLFALHAATVASQGKAIAFVGPQQAGKSTLAASLAQAGHEVLGDDTMAVWRGEPLPRVWPGAGSFKLWSNTVKALGLSPGPAISNRLDKYFVDNPAMAADRPMPLGAVILLDAAAPEEDIQCERLAPLEAIDLLAQHAYRPEFVPLLNRQNAHFNACARLADQVPFWRLKRPRALDRLPETVGWLQENWRRLTVR